MKKISIFFAVVLLCGAVIFSCKKVKDGAPGPKGDTGATGATGADGATGATGQQGPSGSVLHKGGSIVSEIAGVNTFGDNFDVKGIAYNYYVNGDDNIVYLSNQGEGGDEYNIRIKRYDSTGVNFLMLEIRVTQWDTLARFVDFKYVDTKSGIAFLDGDNLPFEDNKVQVSEYSWNNIEFTFDDFKFDPSTGNISFGFNAEYDGSFNSTNQPANLSGTVDAKLGVAALRKASF